MPLDEFVHWCAFYNLAAYEEALSEEKTSPKEFFDRQLLRTGAKDK